MKWLIANHIKNVLLEGARRIVSVEAHDVGLAVLLIGVPFL